MKKGLRPSCGDYRQAERLLRSHKTEPRFSSFTIIWPLFLKNWIRSGCNIMEKGVVARSRNPRYQYHLALALSSDGQAEEAITVYQDLLAMYKRPEILTASDSSSSSGDVSGAERYFRQAVAMKTTTFLRSIISAGCTGRQGALRKRNTFSKNWRDGIRTMSISISISSSLFRYGKGMKAVKYYRKALGLRPDYAEIHNSFRDLPENGTGKAG
jgi:tetratricopeptide (TPR) repeat protein